jgi:hypothetical protein
MRLVLRAALLALVFGFTPGCGEDKVTGPKPSEITGNWNATKLEYVPKSGGHSAVDLIAAGGTATCAINANQTLVLIITPASSVPDTVTGSWVIDGDQFKFSPDDMPGSTSFYDVNLSSNVLELTGGDVWYDFNGDDQYQADEEADNNITLVR